MQVNSINQTNFTGKVVRHTKRINSGNFQPLKKVECSKKEIDKSYENTIKSIQAQHEFAIELDEFMNSKKVKEEVAKLPENVNIQIDNMFNERYLDEPTPINGHAVSIQDVGVVFDNEFAHDRELDNKKISGMSNLHVQKKDGSINKKLIMGWIKSLQDYFNDDKPMKDFDQKLYK